MEGGGFEPSVPRPRIRDRESGPNVTSSKREPAPKHKSGGIRLPIARGPRGTSHFVSVLLRHPCLEIGRRGGARGTVLMTFVSSVHDPKIMLGMLVKVLCGHSIATRRRLPREGNVTFEDLKRVTSDFDVRTVTIEGLTSVRYLLPITVGIVTAIATTRPAGLSWSHDTCCIDEKLDRYPMRAYRNTSVAESDGVAPLFCTASATLFPAGTLDRVVLISNSFLGQCPAEADLIRAVPLFNLAGSRTWSFHRASLCVRLTATIC